MSGVSLCQKNQNIWSIIFQTREMFSLGIMNEILNPLHKIKPIKVIIYETNEFTVGHGLLWICKSPNNYN